MTDDKLDGVMAVDGYKFKYRGRANKPEGMQALFNEARSLREQIEKKQKELLALAIKSIRLPANFSIIEVFESAYGSGTFEFIADVSGMTVSERPVPAEPPKETDPYKQLFSVMDAKQIINAPFLSREEKRRVFGLPLQSEGEQK